jgi:hypothetical protein
MGRVGAIDAANQYILLARLLIILCQFVPSLGHGIAVRAVWGVEFDKD